MGILDITLEYKQQFLEWWYSTSPVNFKVANAGPSVFHEYLHCAHMFFSVSINDYDLFVQNHGVLQMMAAQDPSVQYTSMIPQLTTQMHALQLTATPQVTKH